jgi:hypothetical protein
MVIIELAARLYRADFIVLLPGDGPAAPPCFATVIGIDPLLMK